MAKTTLDEHETEARPSMTAGEALAELLERVESIEGKLDSIIDFVNEAGEQINALAGEGLGQLVGSFLGGGNGDSGDH